MEEEKIELLYLEGLGVMDGELYVLVLLWFRILVLSYPVEIFVCYVLVCLCGYRVGIVICLVPSCVICCFRDVDQIIEGVLRMYSNLIVGVCY